MSSSKSLPSSPRELSQITPAWLTDALGARVRHVDIERLGADAGFASTVARLVLTHDDDRPELPRAIIAKLPLVDECGASDLVDKYRAEAAFYGTLAPHIEVDIPRCYLSRFDPDGPTAVLLLEDLDPGGATEFGDVRADCTDAQASAVIDLLAKLHGAW